MAARATFDAELRAAVQAGRPYGSADLDGMVIDIDHALYEAGFARLEFTKTGEVGRLLVCGCRPATRGMNSDDARAALEEAWIDARFDREAHVISTTPPSVTLDFVTWWSKTSAFCTGSIVVDLEVA